MREFLRSFFGTPNFEALPLFEDDSLVEQYFCAKRLKEALGAASNKGLSGHAAEMLSYLATCSTDQVSAARYHTLGALRELTPRDQRRTMRAYRRLLKKPFPIPSVARETPA